MKDSNVVNRRQDYTYDNNSNLIYVKVHGEKKDTEKVNEQNFYGMKRIDKK